MQKINDCTPNQSKFNARGPVFQVAIKLIRSKSIDTARHPMGKGSPLKTRCVSPGKGSPLKTRCVSPVSERTRSRWSVIRQIFGNDTDLKQSVSWKEFILPNKMQMQHTHTKKPLTIQKPQPNCKMAIGLVDDEGEGVREGLLRRHLQNAPQR